MITASRSLWRNALVTLGILAAATAIGALFRGLQFTEANIVTVYILGALLTALFTRSHLCSGLASLASVLLFNFFFTEPRLTLHAYESGYPVTFAVMLIASLMTGTLANRLADHAKESAQAAHRSKVLFETNQLLQQTEEEDILPTTAKQLKQLLNREVVACPPGIPDGDSQRWDYLEVSAGQRLYGHMGIDQVGRPLEPEESRMVLSILGECALALDNRRNAREKEEAAVLAKNEQLRANLLRAISHDLRSPLTSISGNAENLLHNGDLLEEETRKEMLGDIYDDAIWLIQLMENLLAVTRIGEGRMKLNLTAQLVDEVIAESLSHIHRNSSHQIVTDLPEDLLLARMDARLISQVLINLVDNALKYTPAGSEIRISARREGKFVAISVTDNGPGIPDDQKPRVFEMFYTGNTQVADCRRSLGLGLSLCRSIAQGHGGEITLTDNEPSGCIFTLTIPISEVTLYE